MSQPMHSVDQDQVPLRSVARSVSVRCDGASFVHDFDGLHVDLVGAISGYEGRGISYGEEQHRGSSQRPIDPTHGQPR